MQQENQAQFCRAGKPGRERRWVGRGREKRNTDRIMEALGGLLCQVPACGMGAAVETRGKGVKGVSGHTSGKNGKPGMQKEG